MKGLAEIEFIISVFVFITTISFVTVIIINNVPIFHSVSFSDSLKSKSWQYSELLLLDEGYPKDWNSKTFSEINRLGFSSGSAYMIDKNKLAQINNFCSDPTVGYAKVKALIGVDVTRDIIVQASYLNSSPVIGGTAAICSPPVVTQLRPQFQTVRIGVLNSTRSVVRIGISIL